MLMIMEKEVLLPIHSDCGLPMKKSRIKLHRDTLEELIMLNSELKVMNNFAFSCIEFLYCECQDQDQTDLKK